MFQTSVYGFRFFPVKSVVVIWPLSASMGSHSTLFLGEFSKCGVVSFDSSSKVCFGPLSSSKVCCGPQFLKKCIVGTSDNCSSCVLPPVCCHTHRLTFYGYTRCKRECAVHWFLQQQLCTGLCCYELVSGMRL